MGKNFFNHLGIYDHSVDQVEIWFIFCICLKDLRVGVKAQVHKANPISIPTNTYDFLSTWE